MVETWPLPSLTTGRMTLAAVLWRLWSYEASSLSTTSARERDSTSNQGSYHEKLVRLVDLAPPRSLRGRDMSLSNDRTFAVLYATMVRHNMLQRKEKLRTKQDGTGQQVHARLEVGKTAHKKKKESTTKRCDPVGKKAKKKGRNSTRNRLFRRQITEGKSNDKQVVSLLVQRMALWQSTRTFCL